MTVRDTRLLRNIGIVAHVDAGKTTLTERILFYAGRIHRMGEVHDGNTTTDHDPEERRRGITIGAATVECAWRGHRLQIIDTPGHVDFTIEVERSLRVLDGAIVVLDGVAGVEPQTETVWRQADAHAVPRLVFVNKLDRAGARFEKACADVAELSGGRAVPVVLPIGAESELEGVVDLVGNESDTWRDDAEGTRVVRGPVPEALLAETRRARERLVDALAEIAPDVPEEFVAHGSVCAETLRPAIRRATIAGAIVPILGGSAYANRGVQPLLDAVVEYLPSPRDRPPIIDVTSGQTREPADDAPLSALAFKVLADHHGQRTLVRVYSGVLRKGASVWVPRTSERIRIGRLVRLFAAFSEDVVEAGAGEVVAVVGSSLTTGDTLTDPAQPIVLETIHAPVPVMAVGIEPRTQRDRERFSIALGRLLAEDPSLRVRADEETGQTVLSGMGELHLEVRLRALTERHGVDVRVGPPRVAYRETVGGAAAVTHEHKKQSGGPGQYAKLTLRVETRPPGSGFAFTDAVRGGAIPTEYVPAVRKGVEDALSSGVLGGYPVVDLAVTLLDGAYHSHDSSDLAFALAARAAFLEACRQAGPVLLEPVMRLQLAVPATSVGDAIGDLTRRRGRIVTMEVRDAETIVTAEAPLAELFGYAVALRSLTHGRSTTSMTFEKYAPVPPSVAATVITNP